ncbi:response regulator [Moritella marina ATCC 15381]|uniref:Sensory/regulatory protein RpfC n=1 Tax=Moritella marina ATCC 15381 TaxID=1202962 RepID=A0A5J6WJL5_MORMI|nr:ATP-binding protein [Moritella marina]QFI37694.1 response regulator [Moritella marina ATCC 15381]
MLNTVSIKKRLIILLLCPLLLLTLLIGDRVSESVSTLNQLDKLKYRLELLTESQNLNALLHNMRVNALASDAVTPIDELNAFTASVNRLKQLAPLALQDSGAAVDLLSDLEGVEEEFIDIAAADVNDWSSWISDSTSQLLFILEKNSLDIKDNEIESNIEVLYQLQWLYFWANEENWYINLIVRDIGLDIKPLLQPIVERQQLFIERFISISADNNQISLLQSTFSDQVFTDSYALRSLIQNGHFKATNNYDISALDKRLVLINQVVSNVGANLSVKIKAKVAEAKMHVMAFSIFITALLLCASYLGWMLIQRIIGNLKEIITTLTRIENSHDYSLKISIDGKDEFSAFAKMLNKLIEERYINERHIIQAKESAEQANVAKSSFLANMSHEIRTPLNGVIGMSNILSSTKLTPTQQDYLAIIENSSQTLLILINDILDFSKIESGHLAISHHNCNLREVVYDTVAIVIPSAAFKHLDLVVNIDAELPDDLLLDEHRLRQVLMNLLSNAVKFTNSGAVCLTLKCKQLANNRAELYFSVADTGTGIEADKQKKIFEPFTQEDGTITREFGGTGLGLAISTQLVELMGGQIDINSGKGKGSDFFFTIEADIAVDIRTQKFVETNTQIIVITNEIDSSVKIQAELLRSDITDVVSIAYMQDLLHHLAGNVLDENAEQVIIYCQKSIQLTLKEIDFLNKLKLKHAFVVVQSHKDEKYDFDHRIDGLVTTPLLGNRLLNTIQAALVNKLESFGGKENAAGVLLEQGKAKQVSVESDSTDTGIDSSIDNSADNSINNLILIVEDNLINQKVATLLLKQCGYDSHIANNGEEAVTKVTSGEFKYKAILMDCMMPIMDGFTATEHIREWEVSSATTPTPIIALTASVLDADIQRCFDVGMDDYVPKPFKKDLLMDKIDRLAKVA